jgi:hypothetical protein
MIRAKLLQQLEIATTDIYKQSRWCRSHYIPPVKHFLGRCLSHCITALQPPSHGGPTWKRGLQGVSLTLQRCENGMQIRQGTSHLLAFRWSSTLWLNLLTAPPCYTTKSLYRPPCGPHSSYPTESQLKGVFKYSAYSLGLFTCHFNIFGALKKPVKSRRFTSDVDGLWCRYRSSELYMKWEIRHCKTITQRVAVAQVTVIRNATDISTITLQKLDYALNLIIKPQILIVSDDFVPSTFSQ